MSLANHIVAEDELFPPFSLEEIDDTGASNCFFFSQMFSSIPDLPSAFSLYNTSSSAHDPMFAISSSSSSYINNNNSNNNSLSMGSQLNSYLNGLPPQLRALIPLNILSELSSFSYSPRINLISEGIFINENDVESAYNRHTEVNLSPYFCFPQYKAARKLKIGVCILRKKWREVTNNKMWPHRNIKRLDCEIVTIMKNLELRTSPA